MKSVFADTFHFLALLKADDPHHRSALKFHRVKWRRITADHHFEQAGFKALLA
jgi:hypothetical protein